ncbi:MAG: hypothetical protein HY644_02460 [Acidobacteria bacterium]|nr:hypothetical protein [Acidobacteriota bacterium]
MTTFISSAPFLYLCSKILQPVEKMLFGYGIASGPDEIVLAQLVRVKCIVESRSGVTPDPVDLHNKIVVLRQMGMNICFQVHSHPGTSISATEPSLTDRRTAKTWCAGGPFLGAIFSEGGKYVRFFSGEGSPFRVEVHGKNIQKIKDNVYELLPLESEND